MIETSVWCVIILAADGRQFLASNKDGAAVYFNRKDALKFSKDLREHDFNARVKKGKVVINLEDVNTLTVILPPSPRRV